jgi:cyclase
MSRLVVVARIRPGAETEVARLFTASDQTSLPTDLGVLERSLYTFNDLYLHVIDFRGDAEEAVAIGHRHPGFQDISERLQPYVTPYDPETWRSPHDAVARRFYVWRATG